MSLVTLVNNQKLTLTADKLVYSRNDVEDLQLHFVKASRLSELLASEEARIEKAEASAYEAGYEKGQAEGYDAALGHIAAKLLSLSTEAQAAREAVQSKIGGLAIRIVSRIADEIGPAQTVAALAASAARQLSPQEPVNLRVGVAYLSSVRAVVSENPKFSDKISEITGDPALKDDDCILETEFGQIKASLSVQLNAFKEHFSSEG